MSLFERTLSGAAHNASIGFEYNVGEHVTVEQSDDSFAQGIVTAIDKTMDKSVRVTDEENNSIFVAADKVFPENYEIPEGAVLNAYISNSRPTIDNPYSTLDL